jgi:hypothetical protein
MEVIICAAAFDRIPIFEAEEYALHVYTTLAYPPMDIWVVCTFPIVNEAAMNRVYKSLSRPCLQFFWINT